ncbi:hypothetical protein UlMin_007840 [Ulmus minor]
MSNPLFISLFPIIISTIFLIKWLFSSRKPSKNSPPSPPSFPILGNLPQLGLYPHKSLQKLAQKYGPFMLLHFGSKPVLVASTAEAAKEIMKTNDVVFLNRPKLKITDKLLYQGRDVSTAPYGDYWRQMRGICVAQLLSTKRVMSFRSVREQEVVVLVEKIQDLSAMSLPVNLSDMFISVTNDVVCRAAFGKKYGGDEKGNKFNKLLGEFMELLGCFYVGDFIPWLSWISRVNGFDSKVDKIVREFDEFLDGIVDEHLVANLKIQREKSGSFEDDDDDEEEEDWKDFVDVLLQNQKEKLADFPIDRDNLKAIILDMFAAGTDTTYTVLEWAMTELLRNPRIMKKLQEEITKITEGKQQISESDLENMHYLKAVIKETLRLYPPIPLLVPRESRHDIKLNGYDIAAGTMVITNAWAISRDPKLWENPDEFKPERFMDSDIDFKGQDFELIPFGAGRRGCPGILFAMATNELVLANLVHKFDWELPNGAKGEDLDMSECVGLTIHRKVPLLAIATSKRY